MTKTQYSLDIFGSKIVIDKFEKTVNDITNSDKRTRLNIGYVIGSVKETKKFEFNGIDFPLSFIISRFVWILFSIGMIVIISIFFHRFNIRERVSMKKKATIINQPIKANDINLSGLPLPQINYTIFPLLKVEFLLLFRKGKKWLWLVNITGIVLLAVLPIKIAHQIVLPILWFLQVSRLSDITTKETTNNVHYFAFSAFKPIGRLLTSQLLAAITLMILLASPLIIRLGILSDFTAVISIVLGSVFIVLLSATLGIVSKGKKLFEVLFFMVSYVNINGIAFVDYFGGFEHHPFYLLQLTIFSVILGSTCVFMRRYRLNK
jgi:hypothetical protein